jgi:hypothetical protein
MLALAVFLVLLKKALRPCIFITSAKTFFMVIGKVFWRATALAAGQGTIQSPRLMGQTAYGIGTVAGSPVGKATEAATEALPKFASPASPYAINVKRAEKETDPFAGYLDKPQGFASGGKVSSKKQMLVKRLMDLAEKAKKEVSKSTEPLLNAPDETIVKALHVANQAI